MTDTSAESFDYVAIASDLLATFRLEHPLPWRLDQDWTEEIYDAKGKLVLKPQLSADFIIQLAGSPAANILDEASAEQLAEDLILEKYLVHELPWTLDELTSEIRDANQQSVTFTRNQKISASIIELALRHAADMAVFDMEEATEQAAGLDKKFHAWWDKKRREKRIETGENPDDLSNPWNR